MARGINKVILVGNVGKDPETRSLPSGGAVVNFSLATTETWKKDGEQKEKTEWHNLVAFGKAAEIIAEYVKKGSQLYVEGKLQTRKWQDKEGHDRYTTEIVVDQFQMVGGKPGGEREASAGDYRRATGKGGATERNFEDPGY